jgi:hypothetical protein
VEKLNARWRAEGRPELAIGIAVNHREVIVGNIGSPQRMVYTVIGDAVKSHLALAELTKRAAVRPARRESAAALIPSILKSSRSEPMKWAGQPGPWRSSASLAQSLVGGKSGPPSATLSCGAPNPRLEKGRPVCESTSGRLALPQALPPKVT